MKASVCEKCIHYRRGECHRKICLLMEHSAWKGAKNE